MSHPLYLGLVNSSPLPEAVLGDLLVSALDNNGGASHQGPAHAAAEREVIRWLTDRLDYAGEGLILPGGSHATLQALYLAKARHFPEWLRTGPVAVVAPPRLYCARATHFSVQRAAKVIGLGDDSLVPIAGTGRGEMDAGCLEEAIERDRKEGRCPFAVVATAGTTGTGAIDPLEDLAAICRRHRLWFHIDACYGGALALIESYRDSFRGLREADSVCIDLHKWLFMPLTAGVVLTRHGALVNDLFRVSASYIPDGDYREAYCRGLPTSRRATGLAIWFGLRAVGWKRIERAILDNLRLTRLLEERLRRAGFRVLEDGRLSIACARWEPAGWDDAARDRLQVAIASEIRRAGDAWFATTAHQDQIWLRWNMVNLHSRQEHVERLAVQVIDVARRLTQSARLHP
jgi:aromatic-L-amino-acid/L-tryptophan decarboxylase